MSKAVREDQWRDFPILERQHGGRRIVYLDSGATAQRPKAVIDALMNHMLHIGNPHRGSHVLAIEASEAYESARDKVQEFFSVPRREQVILTRNTTEAMNLIAYSYGRTNVQQGDKIVITIAEHHANLVPWQQVAKEKGATLEFLYIDEEGELLPGEMDKIDSTTKIVSFAHISNVLGVQFPVEELIRRAHEVGAVAIVDGAQSAPHMRVNFVELGADFYVFSGHKMCASQGIGGLIGKLELLEAMPPFLVGGDMIEYVKEQSATWNELPFKFEAGTPNSDGAVTLHAAMDYLDSVGMEAIEAHERKLMEYVLPRMLEIPHIRVLGPKDPAKRHGVIAFTIDDVHSHDVSQILESKGICVRSGHHCAQPLGAYLKAPSTTRMSMYLYNTLEEMDYFLEALKTVRSTMGFKD